MNETKQTSKTKSLSMNEEKIYLLISSYLSFVLNENTPNFYDENFLNLINTLFTKGKIEASRYLRSLFHTQNKKWALVNQNYNNKFEEFIKKDFSYVQPQSNTNHALGLKEAKDIVDWIEANQTYTRYFNHKI